MFCKDYKFQDAGLMIFSSTRDSNDSLNLNFGFIEMVKKLLQYYLEMSSTISLICKTFSGINHNKSKTSDFFQQHYFNNEDSFWLVSFVVILTEIILP